MAASWALFVMQTAFQLDSLSLTKIWQQGESHLLYRQHFKVSLSLTKIWQQVEPYLLCRQHFKVSLSLINIWQQGKSHLLCKQHFKVTVWASPKYGSKVSFICYAYSISKWQFEPHQNMAARWVSFAMHTAFQSDSLSLTKIWQQGESHLLCRQHFKVTVWASPK